MTTAGASRAAKARSRASQAQLQKIHRDWAALHPDRAVEERMLRQDRRQLLENFGHKVNGTPETHARASKVRQGALARLHRSGAISIEQLGAALEIKAAHDRVAMDVGVGTGWGMDRVDISANPEGRFWEALGAVRSEIAYSKWRRALAGVGKGRGPGPVLAMVIEDCGVEGAARRFSMDRRTALAMLKAALNLWTKLRREACRQVDEATLAAAQAGLM